MHGNKLEIQSKIICSEFILSSLITASPHGFIWERHWLREAAEETHLPSLPALPQECFSSGPLSPMCRRPLCRVCFACKAGCRCCPQKQPGGTRGGRGHKEAPLPCHPPGLASLCCHPLRSSPPATPLITSPPRRSPFPSLVRHATPLSPPPPTRPSLCHPPSTRSCVSPGKHALVGVWRHAELQQTHTHTIPLQWIERPDKRHLDRERDREGEREEGERE